MRCRTDCDCSISGAGDKVGGDKVTLDERRRPLVGVSTTLGSTVGLREAAAVTSAVSGRRLPRNYLRATCCRCCRSSIGCDQNIGCTSHSTVKRVCKSTGVSQGGNPHLESQQTLNYRAHPQRNGLPLAVAGGGWSRARPPLPTLTLTPSWTHLVVLLV